MTIKAPSSPFSILDKIRVSNRIEGILRRPSKGEITAFNKFMSRPTLDLEDIERFVTAIQPDAKLRRYAGMDVRVGNHYPPAGGTTIPASLMTILNRINTCSINAWDAHMGYENLHPFTDGNGRSGRMIWYWMMGRNGQSDLGFLHAFYYQTLKNVRK